MPAARRFACFCKYGQMLQLAVLTRERQSWSCSLGEPLGTDLQDEDLLLFLVAGGGFSWVSTEKVCSCNNVCGLSRCFLGESSPSR